MAIGTATIGETPCCGVIVRTWEAYPDPTSATGTRHLPGHWNLPGGKSDVEENGMPVQWYAGPLAPDFAYEQEQIKRGICPDCGKRFE